MGRLYDFQLLKTAIVFDRLHFFANRMQVRLVDALWFTVIGVLKLRERF